MILNFAETLSRKAFEPKDSKSIAVLGLDPSEPEQHRAAQETVTVSHDDDHDHNDDDDDEAPETITKEIARERVKRLDLEAANALKKYCYHIFTFSE